MDKRLFGLGNGYSVVFSGGGQRPPPAEEAGRLLFGPVVSGGLIRGGLLRNGGRLHLDVSSYPGYTTPECGGVAELVVYDKAGERILEGMVADAGQRLREAGITGEISVLKTNAGPAGGSYGCREEYLTRWDGRFGRLADALIPFLVTRQLICGSGAVAHTPRGAAYCLSRPGAPAGSGQSLAARRSRPLISVRDESRRRPPGFRWLRLMVGDPVMSETTTLLRAGATSLVLGMAEAAAAPSDLILVSPVDAIGEVSRDITGRTLVPLAGGRQMSALDIQREYLARATDFAESAGADAVTSGVLRLWERALDAIETGDLGAVGREIDWVIKYQLIERYRAAHDLPLSAPQVAEADLAYHDVRRGRGLYYELQRAGAVDRTARDVDIFEAKTVPPVHGRYRQAG